MITFLLLVYEFHYICLLYNLIVIFKMFSSLSPELIFQEIRACKLKVIYHAYVYMRVKSFGNGRST